MKNVLVTGAGGQLGSELMKAAAGASELNFLIASKSQLDITDFNSVEKFFEENELSYCLNCAAYTRVDEAEKEREEAFLVNRDSAGNLANICQTHLVKLVHLSTD